MWSLWPNIRFLPSIVAEKNVTKNIWEGPTDRGKIVYSSPPSGSGGIIRSKIGIKCVDLILIRLTKCWNNFFSSKFCIRLYCENGKYMIILWKWQVYDYTVKMASIWLYSHLKFQKWKKIRNFSMFFSYFFLFLKLQVTVDYTVKMSSRNIFFSPVQPNFFLQDSESK